MAFLLGNLDIRWHLKTDLQHFSQMIKIRSIAKHTTTTMPYVCKNMVANWLGSMAGSFHSVRFDVDVQHPLEGVGHPVIDAVFQRYHWYEKWMLLVFILKLDCIFFLNQVADQFIDLVKSCYEDFFLSGQIAKLQAMVPSNCRVKLELSQVVALIGLFEDLVDAFTDLAVLLSDVKS